MGVFPSVSWRLPVKEDGKHRAWYLPYEHKIELLIGRIKHLSFVLAHESFHWITALFFTSTEMWELINDFYDKIDNMLPW